MLNYENKKELNNGNIRVLQKYAIRVIYAKIENKVSFSELNISNLF